MDNETANYRYVMFGCFMIYSLTDPDRLRDHADMIGKTKHGVSMSAVQPKHRKFAREVAKGRVPEEVVRELYPNDDVAVALRRVQTPKVLALLGSLVSARWEKMVLLARLSAIVADERTKQSERITALRLGAQVSGYLNNVPDYKPGRRQVNAGEDAATEERLRQLARAVKDTEAA